MSSIEELYRAVIMDHAKNPKNKGLTHNGDYKFVHFKNLTPIKVFSGNRQQPD